MPLQKQFLMSFMSKVMVSGQITMEVSPMIPQTTAYNFTFSRTIYSSYLAIPHVINSTTVVQSHFFENILCLVSSNSIPAGLQAKDGVAIQNYNRGFICNFTSHRINFRLTKSPFKNWRRNDVCFDQQPLTLE